MMRSSRLAILLLAVIMLGNNACTMWGEKKTNSWRTVTAGEELTRLFWTEVKKKDWKELNSHISATVVGTDTHGTSDREQLLSQLKKMEVSDFQIGEVQTQSAGESLVVAYTLTLRGAANGGPLPTSIRCLSVWQQVKNGWLLVAHSAIPKSES